MKKNPLLYCFVILLLGITIIDIINSDKKFSELENRSLKSKVEFSFQKYFKGSFQEKYEEYISDQFILRDSWINLKSRSEFILGKLENNNIVYGKDNYLFEKVTTINDQRIDKNTEAINKFIEKVNVNVTTMIAPNSYGIYEELLPSYIPIINSEEELNKIYDKINCGNNINMTEIMKNNSDKSLYYKTDHHWTTYGAYLAYEEYLKSINKIPIKIENYEEVIINNFYGTYYSKAKPFNSSSDELVYYNFPGINMEIDNMNYDTLYDYSKLDTRDKYSVFLYGNNPLTIIKNTNLKDGSKLLIVKDSYANSMIPFLTQNFEEIHVVDLRSFYESVSEYVNKNDFDEVLILYNLVNFTRDADILKLKS